MSDKEIKKMYDDMKQSGDLLEVYPDLKGSWEKDKTLFKSLYMSNEDIINNIEPLDLEDQY